MRKEIAIGEQMEFSQVDISEIKLDIRCGDEIPQLLRGLQFIYPILHSLSASQARNHCFFGLYNLAMKNFLLIAVDLIPKAR
jgi:hypothetical protein